MFSVKIMSLPFHYDDQTRPLRGTGPLEGYFEATRPNQYHPLSGELKDGRSLLSSKYIREAHHFRLYSMSK